MAVALLNFHNLSKKHDKSLKQNIFSRWKLNAREFILSENEIRMNHYQNEIKKHVIARYKAGFFFLKKIVKPLKKQIMSQTFKIIAIFFDENKKIRTFSQIPSVQSEKIAKHQNFIGSGTANGENFLKGIFF